MAPLCGVGKQPASLFGDKARDLAGEVISAVAIAAERAQVLVAGKFCDGAHVAICPVERGGDREMAQLLWSHRETGFAAELADDVVDRGAGQTMALAGPVEIDEQRTGRGAAWTYFGKVESDLPPEKWTAGLCEFQICLLWSENLKSPIVGTTIWVRAVRCLRTLRRRPDHPIFGGGV
jgi:hypothetical protein